MNPQSLKAFQGTFSNTEGIMNYNFTQILLRKKQAEKLFNSFYRTRRLLKLILVKTVKEKYWPNEFMSIDTIS